MQANSLGLDLAELEDEGGDDVVLLRLGLRVEELQGLAEVVAEGLATDPQLVAFFVRREGVEAVLRVLPRRVGSSELGE